MDDEVIKDEQWDFYSALPNPSWYDDSDDQTEGDEGQSIRIVRGDRSERKCLLCYNNGTG